MDAKRGAVGVVASLTVLLTLAVGPWAAASTGEPSPPWGTGLGTDLVTGARFAEATPAWLTIHLDGPGYASSASALATQQSGALDGLFESLSDLGAVLGGWLVVTSAPAADGAGQVLLQEDTRALVMAAQQALGGGPAMPPKGCDGSGSQYA